MKDSVVYIYAIPMLACVIALFFLFTAIQAIIITLLCYFMSQSILVATIFRLGKKLENYEH